MAKRGFVKGRPYRYLVGHAHKLPPGSVCSNEGCDEPVCAKGQCKRHYFQAYGAAYVEARRGRRYSAEHREEVLERGRAYARARRASHREEIRALKRRSYEANSDAAKARSTERRFPGWTVERRKSRYELQQRACAVCLQPTPFDDLELDHDHACCDVSPTCGNCVRGLLHTSCNKRVDTHERGLNHHLDVARYLERAASLTR